MLQTCRKMLRFAQIANDIYDRRDRTVCGNLLQTATTSLKKKILMWVVARVVAVGGLTQSSKY